MTVTSIQHKLQMYNLEQTFPCHWQHGGEIYFFVLDSKMLVLKAGKQQTSVKLLHLNCQSGFGAFKSPMAWFSLRQAFRGSPSQERHHSRMFLWGKRNNVFLCSLLWVYKPNKHYFLLVKKL